MKFLADMGVSPRTIVHLQRLGHDAVHLHDEGLEQLEDPKILEKARTEQRVLLAHDLDFGELLAASGGRLPSVVTFRLRNMRPDHVDAYLDRVISDHADALNRGAIVTVTEASIRLRLLPIQ
jgi:predicted nuclease of predicted toxin-antitoxin system